MIYLIRIFGVKPRLYSQSTGICNDLRQKEIILVLNEHFPPLFASSCSVRTESFSNSFFQM